MAADLGLPAASSLESPQIWAAAGAAHGTASGDGPWHGDLDSAAGGDRGATT
jgi:hypothetical protein